MEYLGKEVQKVHVVSRIQKSGKCQNYCYNFACCWKTKAIFKGIVLEFGHLNFHSICSQLGSQRDLTALVSIAWGFSSIQGKVMGVKHCIHCGRIRGSHWLSSLGPFLIMAATSKLKHHFQPWSSIKMMLSFEIMPHYLRN